MDTGAAEIFRARQAAGDLISFVRQSSAETKERLAVELPDDLFGAVGEHAVPRPGVSSISPTYENLLFAAARPDEDYPVFLLATAVLLIDLLQSPDAPDDLYWNWDAFSIQYGSADPPQRAAIMGGFRALSASKRTLLQDPPGYEDCMTFDKDVVLARLEGHGIPHLKTAISQGIDAETAGRMWAQASENPLSQAETMAFRFLFERKEGMSPPGASKCPLIPWSA